MNLNFKNEKKSVGLEKMHMNRGLSPGKEQPSYPARIIQNDIVFMNSSRVDGIVFMNSAVVDEFIKVQNMILIRN